MKRFLLPLVLWICCLPAFAAAAESPGMGAMLLLSEIDRHKGKVVVLNFFATWCLPCQEEIPGLVKLRRRYPVDRVAILGLSLDEDPALVPPFVAKYGINYPVKMASPDVLRMFNIRSVPHNTVYDATGRLAANQPGLIAEEDFQEAIDRLLEQKK
ncbi:MAG: TlpA family protein disulfide reductase [Deltaproteobacteria bacterium]|jgi:thiol-disulfide isomerase/thioredoxin|nr:TlpA family protein disulfide reductase [Deltaproteobacteria bacterium]